MLCEFVLATKEGKSIKVLILVLMEYALREIEIVHLKFPDNVVLILVLMEYALRGL